jgi:hypothetical protein
VCPIAQVLPRLVSVPPKGLKPLFASGNWESTRATTIASGEFVTRPEGRPIALTSPCRTAPAKTSAAATASSLRGTQWHQYASRFVLGGLITVTTGLIAQKFGPVFGGLFLAFPAIFPAGATLIAKRERQKKARIGLDGTLRGQRAAALDGAGTVFGALALVCFAWITWKQLPAHEPAAVRGVASALWVTVSVTLWWVRKRLGMLRARFRHFRAANQG